jgi:bifunctional non-homologous end joining protein LigD
MLLLRTEKLAEGDDWLYELKLAGFRAVAFKSRGKVFIRSRNDKDFNARFPSIVKALTALPDETVIDGEIVALDRQGKPSFNALQNYSSSKTPLLYHVFDIMMLSGKTVMSEPLARRRELLERKILPKLAEPVRYSPELKAGLSDLIDSVKEQGFEGLVAKAPRQRI